MILISDIAVIVLAIAAMIIAARKGRARDTRGYVVAGRSLTLPFFVASLVATWYGAILGSGEFILRYGVVFIMCFGVPYYLVAILYSAYLARRVHRSEAVSIPDQFGKVYGQRGRIISAIVLLAITIPASFQLMIGIILEHSLQIPFLPSIIIGTILSIAVVAGGGLRSDIYANTVQFVLMYAGMASLLVFAISTHGSVASMLAEMPATHGSIPGTIGWTGIAGWFLIALQTFIDPNFYVRTVAASSDSVARRGLAVSVACWIIFDSMQLIAGLYVLTYAPSTEPTLSYLAFAADILPPVYRGVFIASLIAVVMSALDGYALSSATILAHDIAPNLGRTFAPIVRYRVSLMIIACIGCIVAITVPSIIAIIFYGGSIAVSAVLLPLVLSFTNYAQKLRSTITLQLVLPATVSIASYIFSIGEPIFVGLCASLLCTGLTLLYHQHGKTTRNTLHGL